MAVEYALRIYNPAGSLQALISDFRGLSYRKEINAPGLLSFDLASDHRAIAYFEADAQVEVWRRDEANSISWYCDFYGFWRDAERSANDSGISNYRAICVGQMDLLDRAIVAYSTDVSNRSTFASAKAETIMKTLVTRNATSAGTTADGRVRNVDGWGSYMSVAADSTAGNTLTYSCAYKNLLDALQELSLLGNLDFNLVKTGVRAWEFRTYSLLGTDRSASVVFALNYGNMRNPVLRLNKLPERTVAVVGGQGGGISRTMAVRTGVNYSGTVNSREVFVNASEYSGTAGLYSAGDLRMFELQAFAGLEWDVIQVPSTLYGLHYFLGDLVTGYYQGVTATKQIEAVTVTVEPGTTQIETIKMETADA